MELEEVVEDEEEEEKAMREVEVEERRRRGGCGGGGGGGQGARLEGVGGGEDMQVNLRFMSSIQILNCQSLLHCWK